jgi:hypothetical protein
MRFKVNNTIPSEERYWKPYFAWRPVKAKAGPFKEENWVWLEWVGVHCEWWACFSACGWEYTYCTWEYMKENNE